MAAAPRVLQTPIGDGYPFSSKQDNDEDFFVCSHSSLRTVHELGNYFC